MWTQPCMAKYPRAFILWMVFKSSLHTPVLYFRKYTRTFIIQTSFPPSLFFGLLQSQSLMAPFFLQNVVENMVVAWTILSFVSSNWEVWSYKQEQIQLVHILLTLAC